MVERQFHHMSTGTQSIDRAAQVLVHVLETSEPPTVGALSARLGLPKSTASRLVGALERQGQDPGQAEEGQGQDRHQEGEGGRRLPDDGEAQGQGQDQGQARQGQVPELESGRLNEPTTPAALFGGAASNPNGRSA